MRGSETERMTLDGNEWERGEGTREESKRDGKGRKGNDTK